MAAITFPTGGRLMSGQYAESVVPNVLRSQMEGGLPKQAKRSSKQIVNHEVVYLYSTAELETFRTFVHTTAKDGALLFNWVNPITNANTEARIVDGLYSINPLNARFTMFYVTMTIETLR